MTRMVGAGRMKDCRSRLPLDVAGLLSILAVAATYAQAQPVRTSSEVFRSPVDTELDPRGASVDGGQEEITVLGRRPLFQAAPVPDYGAGGSPWETGRAIRDTMTGADTAPFGNAYNLGSLLGSDERSNETGGQFVAPRHQ